MPMTSVAQYLSEHGPSRSSRIVEALVASGFSAEAARQRVSRARPPIRSFPVPLLPKREAFLYLEKDRNGERFWQNFLRDLRETNSITAAAIDGVIARGGMIPADQFAVVSGATVRPKTGQVPADTVASRLIKSDFLKEFHDQGYGRCFHTAPSLAMGTTAAMRARDITERVLLDGLREWCRKIGLASYNAIRIRGDEDLKPIGPFAFDLAGPSYLLPLQGSASKPGFVVADVFAEGILTVHEIQFFIRKARVLKASFKDIGILSIIVAEGFTGEAMTAGHAAGVMLATPKDLFGKRVGEAIASLCEVLKNAAKYASSSPERLTMLLNNLFDIEGRNKNLRGILFEMVAGYLARRTAMTMDMGVTAKDPSTGKTADIDVQTITNQNALVTAIECKGKEPGGELSLAEVEEWLAKIPTFRAHYAQHGYLREAEQRFEIWTSGSIAPDALAKLKDEQVRRVKAKIDWKSGDAVLALARAGKEKALADALNQHFFRHPFAEVANHLEADEAAGKVPSWIAPAKSNLPEFQDSAIEVVSLDGELDAAE